MDYTTSAGANGPPGASFPRNQPRKSLTARISQIEARIIAAGGQVTHSPSSGTLAVGENNGASQNAAREAQLEALQSCNDLEKLRAVALASFTQLEEAKAEVMSLNQALDQARSQMAAVRLRAEAKEAQVSELEATVQHQAARLESLQKTQEPGLRQSPSLTEINKNTVARRPSASQPRYGQGAQDNPGALPTSYSPSPPPGADRTSSPLHNLVRHTSLKYSAMNSEISPAPSPGPNTPSPQPSSSQTSSQKANDTHHHGDSQDTHKSTLDSDAQHKNDAAKVSPLKLDPAADRTTPSDASNDSHVVAGASAEAGGSHDHGKRKGKDKKDKDKEKKKNKDKTARQEQPDSANSRNTTASAEGTGTATATSPRGAASANPLTASSDSPLGSRSARSPRSKHDGEEGSDSTATPHDGTEKKRFQNPFKRKNTATSSLTASSDDPNAAAAATGSTSPRGAVSPRAHRKDSSEKDKNKKKDGSRGSRDAKTDGDPSNLTSSNTSTHSGSPSKARAQKDDHNADIGLNDDSNAATLETGSNGSEGIVAYSPRSQVAGSMSTDTTPKTPKRKDKLPKSSSPLSSNPSGRAVAAEEISTDVESTGRRGTNGGAAVFGDDMAFIGIIDPIQVGKRRGARGGTPQRSPSPVTSVTNTSTARSPSPTQLVGKRRPRDHGENATDNEGSYNNDVTEARFKAERKKTSTATYDYGVAFGIRRGRCAEPCECNGYVKHDDNNACRVCSHFPAQHEDMGPVSDDEEDAEKSLPSGAAKTMLERAKAALDGSEEGMEENQSKQDGSKEEEITTNTSAAVEENPPIIDAHWLVEFNDCFFLSQLGKGNSSTVFLGEYQNQQVAIKVLRQETHKRDLEDFKKEMEIMCSLRSPHIVHFYGATLAPKLCIVLEYCSQGTLFHYLHDDLNYVDWRLALRWMIESARGINTLHLWRPQIVHRDLKTLNLLLDDKLKIKVCDFGLSRYVSGEHDQSTFFKMRGTFAYFAPEVYQGKPFTSKSDIYSLGIILWEVIHRIIFGTHTRPFAEFKQITHDFQIIIQAAKGLRPTLPLSTPRPLVKLYEDCVAANPDARPTCQEIIERLEQISAFYDEHADTWDALVKGGVKLSARPLLLRREVSQAAGVPGRMSPNRSPGRGELLRTPVGSRNLKDDLTRRGVSTAMLRERAMSASTPTGSGTLESSSSSGSTATGSGEKTSSSSFVGPSGAQLMRVQSHVPSTGTTPYSPPDLIKTQSTIESNRSGSPGLFPLRNSPSATSPLASSSETPPVLVMSSSNSSIGTSVTANTSTGPTTNDTITHTGSSALSTPQTSVASLVSPMDSGRSSTDAPEDFTHQQPSSDAPAPASGADTPASDASTTTSPSATDHPALASPSKKSSKSKKKKVFDVDPASGASATPGDDSKPSKKKSGKKKKSSKNADVTSGESTSFATASSSDSEQE